MLTKKFQKRTEDFVCEKCGYSMVGDGYTNHCQKCLWSKHVDNNPGDRAATCLGLMEPVSLELRKRGRYFILQRCVKCGFERFNGLRDEDDFDAALRINTPKK